MCFISSVLNPSSIGTVATIVGIDHNLVDMDEVWDQPPESREAFLQEACGSEPELFAHVRELLSLAESTSDTLVYPAVNSVTFRV